MGNGNDINVMVSGIIQIDDPLERAKRATHTINEMNRAIELLSHNRGQSLAEILASPSVTQAEIAETLGITPGRLHQLLYGKAGKKAAATPNATAAPRATHRHHYHPISWTRDGAQYAITMKCDCGLTRVDAATHLPKELEGTYPAH